MEQQFVYRMLVLRATGILFLLAFIGAALPESWMRAVYEWEGKLGPWPGGALLLYLARALSIVYGFYGLLALYMSFDVQRYRPLIRFMALASFPFAPVMFVVIWSVGLPTPWLVSEPVSILVISALWFAVSRPINPAYADAEDERREENGRPTPFRSKEVSQV